MLPPILARDLARGQSTHVARKRKQAYTNLAGGDFARKPSDAANLKRLKQ
jgi:hypothetical protein